LILYPYVAGRDGYQLALSPAQWRAFGAAVRGLHTAPLPAALARRLPRETFSPAWRRRVRAFMTENAGAPDPPGPTDAPAREMRALLTTHRARIDALVERAEHLARALRARPLPLALVHADLHPGNLLITPAGALYLVDWDQPALAPIERDLMFFGGGAGPGWRGPEAAALFYAGYGPAARDSDRLAYYRCERLIVDIAEFCQQVLGPPADPAGPAEADLADRAQAVRWLSAAFDPGGDADLALATEEG
jgi:spectinomycin phosphotransferase